MREPEIAAPEGCDINLGIQCHILSVVNRRLINSTDRNRVPPRYSTKNCTRRQNNIGLRQTPFPMSILGDLANRTLEETRLAKIPDPRNRTTEKTVLELNPVEIGQSLQSRLQKVLGNNAGQYRTLSPMSYRQAISRGTTSCQLGRRRGGCHRRRQLRPPSCGYRGDIARSVVIMWRSDGNLLGEFLTTITKFLCLLLVLAKNHMFQS